MLKETQTCWSGMILLKHDNSLTLIFHSTHEFYDLHFLALIHLDKYQVPAKCPACKKVATTLEASKIIYKLKVILGNFCTNFGNMNERILALENPLHWLTLCEHVPQKGLHKFKKRNLKK